MVYTIRVEGLTESRVKQVVSFANHPNQGITWNNILDSSLTGLDQSMPFVSFSQDYGDRNSTENSKVHIHHQEDGLVATIRSAQKIDYFMGGPNYDYRAAVGYLAKSFGKAVALVTKLHEAYGGEPAEDVKEWFNVAMRRLYFQENDVLQLNREGKKWPDHPITNWRQAIEDLNSKIVAFESSREYATEFFHRNGFRELDESLLGKIDPQTEPYALHNQTAIGVFNQVKPSRREFIMVLDSAKKGTLGMTQRAGSLPLRYVPFI